MWKPNPSIKRGGCVTTKNKPELVHLQLDSFDATLVIEDSYKWTPQDNTAGKMLAKAAEIMKKYPHCTRIEITLDRLNWTRFVTREDLKKELK